MTVPEVAEHLGLAAATVRRLISRGDLPSDYNPNRRRRRLVKKRTLDLWIARGVVAWGCGGVGVLTGTPLLARALPSDQHL
jgi:excisionase family DNA binding protein